MAQQVASLYATLSLEGNLRSELQRAKGALQGFGGTARDVTAGVMGAFGRVAAMAATGFGLSKGLGVASDFQSTMREISARTGATADEMANISTFALKMGADTVFSGQQAGDALLQLMTTGQSAAEAIETLPAVLNLAAAGGVDLAKAADGVTDVMAAFGLTGKAAADSVADSLARAAGTSSASVDDLLAGFGNVGPIAKQFGMSVEDTAATLAIFSENGIKSAEAGTQLKSMLTQLASPTARKEMQRLGISMFDLQGKSRPLANVISDIGNKMKGMTDEQRVASLKALGGSYGQIGLAALTSGMSIDEMVEKMRASASAADVASARMDTFKGATNSLMGSIETLAIKALTPLMEKVLTPLVQEMTKVVNKVSDFADDVQEMGLGPAVQKWFNSGMDWLKENGPGIFEGALKLAFTWRGEIVKWVTDNGPKIIGGIDAWFNNAWQWVENNGPGIIKTAIENAFKGLGEIVTMITTIAPPLLDAVNNWFGKGFAFIEQHGGQLISTALEAAFKFLKDSVAAIAKIAPDIWEGIKTWFGNAWDAFKSAAPQIVETAFKEAFKLIKEFAGWLISNAPDIAKGVLDWFKGAFDWIVNEGGPFVGSVIKAALNGIGSAFGIEDLSTKITDGFKSIFGEGSPVRALFDSFKGFVEGIFKAIGDIIKVPVQIVKDILGIKDKGGESAESMADFDKQFARRGETAQAVIGAVLPGVQIPTGAKDFDFSKLAQAKGDVEGLNNALASVAQTAKPQFQALLEQYLPAAFTIAFGEESAATTLSKAFLGEGGTLSALLATAGKNMETLGTKAAGIGDAIGTGMQPVAGKMVAPVAQGTRQIGKLLSALAGKSGFFSELGMIGALLVSEADKLEGRAMGGPVVGGTPYVVGERGPELFVPRGSGSIVPNHAMGGTSIQIGTVVVNGVNDPAAFYNAIEREARRRNKGGI